MSRKMCSTCKPLLPPFSFRCIGEIYGGVCAFVCFPLSLFGWAFLCRGRHVSRWTGCHDMTNGDLAIYVWNASVICASVISFEQGGTLARVLSRRLNRMPVFAQESLVGYPLLLWQYTSTHCHGSHGYMPGVILFIYLKPLTALPSFLYPVIQTCCQTWSWGATPSPAKNKKSRHPSSLGPELDEPWERHVPLNSSDKTTWANGELFKHEGPWALNWQQLL